MLDHNDLLPEEKAYPAIVQKLQITYQMKPEEMQVMARVHDASHRVLIPSLCLSLFTLEIASS